MNDSVNRRKRSKRRRRRKGPGGITSSHAGGYNSSSPSLMTGRSNVPNAIRNDGSVDPFALFCALHLGIGPDDNYQPMGIPGVARRFGIEPRRVRESLRQYAMDNDSIRQLNFEMGMARLDTRVVPEGISRTEQARMHWELFLEAAADLRDWQSILYVPEMDDDEDDDDLDDDDLDDALSIDDEMDDEEEVLPPPAPEPEPEEPPEEPPAPTRRRRSTSPRSRSRAKAEEAPAEEAAPEKAEEKPKRRRRTTRKKAADEDGSA